MFERLGRLAGSEKNEKRQRLEAVIADIDFPAIQEEFRTILKRSGVDDRTAEKMLKNVDLENIKIKAQEYDGSPASNWIGTVDGKKVILNENQKMDEGEEVLRNSILQTIIHEFIHTLGQSEKESFFDRSPSGLHHTEGKRGVFQGINEAVTDMVALAIQESYVKKKGLSTSTPSFEHYLEMKNYFNVLVDMIAEHVGVPKEMVIQGFVQAYFSKKKELYEFMRIASEEFEPNTQEGELFEYSKRVNPYSIFPGEPHTPYSAYEVDKRFPGLKATYEELAEHKRQDLLDAFQRLL